MNFKDKIINYTDKNKNDDNKNLYEKYYMKSYNNHLINSKNALLMLIGPSGSGKTTSIINFIMRCIYNKNYIPFSEIYYFTASSSDEPLLAYLKSIIDNNLYIIDDINNLPKIEDFKDSNKQEKRIMIFDDINNLDKKKSLIVDKWASSGRKFASHIFFIAQNLINVSNQIRRNINYLFIYRQRENSIINRIIKQYNIYNIDEELFKKIYLEATKNKGDFLMLDLTDNSKYPFRHNFIDIIDININN